MLARDNENFRTPGEISFVLGEHGFSSFQVEKFQKSCRKKNKQEQTNSLR